MRRSVAGILEEFVIELIAGTLLEVKPGALIGGVSGAVSDRAGRRSPTLSKVDRGRKIWNYRVSGGKRDYLVKIRVQGELTKRGADADIEVTCNCPFFRWQGPEHWARAGGYEYERPAGTASFPSVMDPGKKHPICKHSVAALKQFESAFLA